MSVVGWKQKTFYIDSKHVMKITFYNKDNLQCKIEDENLYNGWEECDATINENYSRETLCVWA